MENCFFGTAESIASDGVVRFAAGQARPGMIDPRDISDVAARVLADRSWGSGTHELPGPASISFEEVAETLPAELGRKVRYVPISPEAAADSARKMVGDEWQAEATRGYSSAYAAGWGDFMTDWVPQISGHAARSFADFAREIMVPALKGWLPSQGGDRRRQTQPIIDRATVALRA